MNLYIDENLSSKAIISALQKNHNIDYPRKAEYEYNLTINSRRLDWYERTNRVVTKFVMIPHVLLRKFIEFLQKKSNNLDESLHILRKKIQKIIAYNFLFVLPYFRRQDDESKTDQSIFEDAVRSGRHIITIDRDFVILARKATNKGIKFPNIYVLSAETKHKLTNDSFAALIDYFLESNFFQKNVNLNDSNVFYVSCNFEKNLIVFERYELNNLKNLRSAKKKIKFDPVFNKTYIINFNFNKKQIFSKKYT